MRPGATFDDVLEAMIGGPLPEAPPAARTAYVHAPVLGFFSFGPGPTVSAVTYAAAAYGFTRGTHHAGSPAIGRTAEAPHQARVASPPAAAPRRAARPRRTLTPTQQRALERLVAMGAPLAGDATVDELRSAFRGLARRYHPDRHPGASEQERARLATLFSQAREAYRQLQFAAGA